MDAEVLKIVGQVAGIGGISLGVFLLLFREVIKKNIFPSLKQEHAYSLLKLALILIWSIALIGIGAWILSSYLQQALNRSPTDYNSNNNNEITLKRENSESTLEDDKENSESTLENYNSPVSGREKDAKPVLENYKANSFRKKTVNDPVIENYKAPASGKKISESASSQEELVKILDMRAKKINDNLSQYYNYADVKNYLNEFNRLHKLHKKALKDGNIVLAHEILIDIHKLSSNLERSNVWTGHNIKAPSPMYMYRICGDAFQRGRLIKGYICGNMKNCNYPTDKGIYVLEDIYTLKDEKITKKETTKFKTSYDVSFIKSSYKSILTGSGRSMPANPRFVSNPELMSGFCNTSRKKNILK